MTTDGFQYKFDSPQVKLRLISHIKELGNMRKISEIGEVTA